MAEAGGGGLCPTGAARGVWLGASVLTPPCILLLVVLNLNQMGRLYLRREGRALSVLASWRALATGWDLSWSLATGLTAGGSLDTRWMAACLFLACR